MFCSFTLGVIVLIVVYYVIDFVLRSLKVGKLTEKRVFITGCDSGFGRLAASRLDNLGFHVFAGCFTKDGAKSLSESCSSRLTTLILDVRSSESIEQAVRLVQEKLPPDTGLWALVNNAGIAGMFLPSELCSKQDIMETLDVNLFGVLEVTRQFLPLLRKSQGRVINTSSVAGRLAFYSIPYTISKYGVECFSDILRRETRRQGIKVSIVEPGFFKTSVLSDKIIRDCIENFGRHKPEVQAVYGGESLITRTQANIRKRKSSMAPDLNPVVDAYIYAITSKFPRTRYVVGTDAKFYYIPLSYLPDDVADLLLVCLNKISNTIKD